MSNRLITVRPLKDRLASSRPFDAAYRATRRYHLTCRRCGWDGGTVTGTAEAARVLRRHPCTAHLAGPCAEPAGVR